MGQPVLPGPRAHLPLSRVLPELLALLGLKELAEALEQQDPLEE